MKAERPDPSPEGESSFVALLDAARAGCARALGSLMARSRPGLLRVARRRLLGRPTAGESPSDVVQDASIVAVRRLGGFREAGEQGFRAWLGRIVDLSARNTLRRGRVRAAVPIDPAGPTPADPGSSPSSGPARGDEAGQLAEAMALLPEHDRRVLGWHVGEGLTFAEIGRRTGRSDVAAAKACRRALAHLHLCLLRVRRGGRAVGPPPG